MTKKETKYPIIDEHRKHYIRYPILNKNGKWNAVDVVEEGGYIPLIAPVGFDTEAECQKSCDIHNKYHKFTKKQIFKILNNSFKAVRL